VGIALNIVGILLVLFVGIWVLQGSVYRERQEHRGCAGWAKRRLMPSEHHSNGHKHLVGERRCRTHNRTIGIGYETNGYGRFQPLLAGPNPEKIPAQQ
jgi:hypothetical protein